MFQSPMLRSQSSMRLPMYSGVHSTVGVRVEHLLAQVAHGDEPVVGDAEDERRVAAPAVRVAVLVQPGLDEEAALAEVADDLVGRLDRREAVQPAVVVVEAAGLVDGHQHRQVLALAELEVLGAAARRDVDDAGALVERDLVPRDRRGARRPRPAAGCRTGPCSASRRAPTPRLALLERLVRIARDGDPLAVRAPAVLAVGLHGGRDVRRQRPRRRRPDDERLALPVDEREADEERRVGAVLVDAGLRQLVLRERRAAARAPLGRAVAHVEPVALVHRASASARRTRCSCR